MLRPTSLCIAALLAGCAPAFHVPGDTAYSQQYLLRNIPSNLAREGAIKLLSQEPESAAKHFQAALKLRPDAPSLHILLGLAFHIIYLEGGNTFPQAAAAYDVAQRYDDRIALPLLLRAHLEYDKRNYSNAKLYYLKALARSDDDNHEALSGLMSAAYYDGDLDLAATALSQAKAYGVEQENVLRLELILQEIGYGSQSAPTTGNGDVAKRTLQDKLGYSADEASRFLDVLKNLRQKAMLLAQADVSSATSKTDEVVETGVMTNRSSSSLVPIHDNNKETGEQPSSGMKKWFECDLQPGFSENSSGSRATTGGDETEKLPALPGICPGATTPPVVQFDTTIMRVQEASGSSYGIDFLNALNIFFSGSRVRTSTQPLNSNEVSGEVTKTFTYALGSSPSVNYISYTLNIANAFGKRSEILSQPSIVAIDRLPATFFSGAVVTLGVSGTNNASSTISDKPIGVSLSITPTVIDKERLNINVKIARSELASGALHPANSSFVQALATTRTSVATNLTAKFDETIVISGLTENELTTSQSGTPILKEIPVLRALFAHQQNVRTTSSIVVTLTPRRYGQEASKPIGQPELDRLTRVKLSELTSRFSLDKAGDANPALDRNSLLSIQRESDLRYRPLRGKPQLKRHIDEAILLIQR